MRQPAVAALGLVLGAVAGCLNPEPFLCYDDLDCVFDGSPGLCVLSEQTCVYPEPGCVTQWSTADGECATAPPSAVTGGSSGGEGTGGEGGPGGDPGTTSGGEDSSDTGPPGTTDAPPPPPGDSSGEPPSRGCVGPTDDITAQGVVWASSIFSDDFHAPLSVDGSYASSWFSSGPEGGGQPSIYRWEVLAPLCIDQISVIGNGLHQNDNFREDFGFEHMVIRVYDEADAVVFQEMANVFGTPDPPVVVYPGVEGVRVELELFDHESNDCGGFSELEIIGN